VRADPVVFAVEDGPQQQRDQQVIAVEPLLGVAEGGLRPLGRFQLLGQLEQRQLRRAVALAGEQADGAAVAGAAASAPWTASSTPLGPVLAAE
jgi:hypothetical protein